MGRNLDTIIGDLLPDELLTIDTRRQAPKRAVEGLRELRQIAGKAQTDIATALSIKQPSVSKIEKQTDMYLSTLRNYVEAVGGKLELTVKLPKQPALRIQHLGEVIPVAAANVRIQRKSGLPPQRRRHG